MINLVKYSIIFLVGLLFSSCSSILHTAYIVEDLMEDEDHSFGTYEFQGIGYGDALYFVAPSNYGSPLLKYANGAISPVMLNAPSLLVPRYFVEFQDDLYFATTPRSKANGLWKLGNTPTQIATSEVALTIPDTYLTHNNLLVFIGTNEDKGKEPHVFNGNSVEIIDLWPGKRGSDPLGMHGYKDEMVFSARDSLLGIELWVYSLPDKEVRLLDLFPGSKSSSPAFFNTFKDKLVFSATGPGVGRELVLYDGNSHQFVDISKGEDGSSPIYFKQFRDELYFHAHDSLHGKELYSYDGEQVKRVTDINPGPGDGTPRRSVTQSDQAVVYEDVLYFMANDGVHGDELWSYDGKSVKMIKDIFPGENGSNPKWLTVFDGKLFFTANDDEKGIELWVHDGKKTNVLKDMNEGRFNSSPMFLIVHKDKLYCTAEDQKYGRELWVVKEKKDN